MKYAILHDGLDDAPLLDVQGFPVEMDPVERTAIEESECEERLQHLVAENLAFLALGGTL